MKRKHFFNRLSVRYRYLFSFLLVALIPISIILIFFYQYNVEELKQDVDSINISRVTQIKVGFESEILKQYSLANALSESSSFLPLSMQESAGSNYEALIILREYMSYRNLNTASAVILINKNQAYTNTGISSCSAYFKYILQLEQSQGDLLLSSLAERLSGVSTAILPVTLKDGTAFLVCAYSIPGYRSNPSAVLLTGLDHSQILSLFEPLLSRFEGNAFILNKQMEIVFETGGEGNLSEGLREAILVADYDSKKQILPVEVDDQSYSIIFSRSEKTGLIYGVIAEEDTCLTQVVKQTTLIWLMVLLTLVICIIVIILLTLFNYLPVKKLLALTGKSQRLYGDEYIQIGEAFIDNTTKADRLEAALEQQRPYVLERLLGYVLYSQTTPEQIQQLFHSMDIRFDHGCFFIMCIKVLRNNSSKQGYSYFKTVVIDTVSTMNCQCCTYYSLERSGEDELSISVNCDNTVNQRDCAEQLRQSITEQLGTEFFFTIGVGSMQEQVEELKTSLYEASMLVEIQVEKPISFLEDLDEEQGSLTNLYSTKDILLLQFQLRQGDEFNVRRTFEKLCARASDCSKSMLISRYLYSYIINAIAEVVQQMNRVDLSGQLRQLMQFKSAEEFKKCADQLIGDFCHVINECKRNNNSILRDRIIAYVREKIANANLSLESIAEAFDLSPYYISRFFRDQNNINLKDYITEMRLSMAKDLLVSTDQSVTKIVTAIGYISTSSFIRKFKLAEGMTPGEYRERFMKSRVVQNN